MSEIQQSDAMETLYWALLFSIRYKPTDAGGVFFSPKELKKFAAR